MSSFDTFISMTIEYRISMTIENLQFATTLDDYMQKMLTISILMIDV